MPPSSDDTSELAVSADVKRNDVARIEPTQLSVFVPMKLGRMLLMACIITREESKKNVKA